MIKENETELIVAMYGIFYFSLLDMKLIDEKTGREYTTPERLFENDIVVIYRYLAEKIKHLTKKDLEKKAELFNSFVKKLYDTYNTNQFLLGMFLFEKYILSQDHSAKVIYLPKINRSIKELQKRILEHNSTEKSKEINIDTGKAASNIWRLFNGKAQLTKEMREARINQWKEAARKSSKKIKDRYFLG
jgi:hypothetical protein